MKIIKSLFAFATFFALNLASAQSITDKWPQIKAYQELISKTYHPAEQGNLEPIKNNSSLLLEKAEALTVESIPKEFRNPNVLQTMLYLKTQTKILNDLVQKKASDEDISQAIKKLHEIFHKIVGLCTTEK
jgi:hypothetical protein